MIDSQGNVQVSLVSSKTKVTPIKRLMILRLEHLLAHLRQVLDIPLSHLCAWTDSTIVLNWLDGTSRPLLETGYLPSWSLFPQENGTMLVDLITRLTVPLGDSIRLSSFNIRYGGMDLYGSNDHLLTGQKQNFLPPNKLPEKEREISLLATVAKNSPLIPLDRYSNFNRLKRVTAWVLRFSLLTSVSHLCLPSS